MTALKLRIEWDVVAKQIADSPAVPLDYIVMALRTQAGCYTRSAGVKYNELADTIEVAASIFSEQKT